MNAGYCVLCLRWIGFSRLGLGKAANCLIRKVENDRMFQPCRNRPTDPSSDKNQHLVEQLVTAL